METPKLLEYKEIKEKALKEYPDKKMEWTAIDINAFSRIAYTAGYLQAQKDMLNSMSNL